VIQRHLVRAVQRTRPGLTDILLHKENAPCHRARTMEEVYERLNISLVNHLPYSPDLAPCDFALFPRLKGYLRGTHFDNECDLTTAVNTFLANLTVADFRDIFTKWCERWHKCVEHNGEVLVERKNRKHITKTVLVVIDGVEIDVNVSPRLSRCGRTYVYFCLCFLYCSR